MAPQSDLSIVQPLPPLSHPDTPYRHRECGFVSAGLDAHRRAATVAMADGARSQGAYIGDVKVAGASTGPLHGLTAVVKVRPRQAKASAAASPGT